MLLATGMKQTLVPSCVDPAGAAHPHWTPSLHKGTPALGSGTESEETHRRGRCWKFRRAERTPQEHSELAVPGHSPPFLKHHPPWEGGQGLLLVRFNHLPADVKTNSTSILFGSLLGIQWWKLQHWSREKGRHLPVVLGGMIPDSRVCSAAGGNGPGDLLWDHINRRALEQEPWAHTGLHMSIITAKLANIH